MNYPKIATTAIITLTLSLAQAQDTAKDVLQAMGFEKMEVSDDVRKTIEEVDKDPTHGDHVQKRGNGMTVVNNIKTDTTQEGYINQVEGDREIVLRVYRDESGEYATGAYTKDGRFITMKKTDVVKTLQGFCKLFSKTTRI